MVLLHPVRERSVPQSGGDSHHGVEATVVLPLGPLVEGSLQAAHHARAVHCCNSRNPETSRGPTIYEIGAYTMRMYDVRLDVATERADQASLL
jgi:hypothetical protein